MSPPNRGRRKRPLPQRPDPVPEAPRSLLTLLRKNASVYKYFTALQLNLEYDVAVWKDKARHYQQKYHEQIELQKEAIENIPSPKPAAVAACSKESPSQKDIPNHEDEKMDHFVSGKNGNDNTSIIHDDIFDKELSSSSNSSQNSKDVFNSDKVVDDGKLAHKAKDSMGCKNATQDDGCFPVMISVPNHCENNEDELFSIDGRYDGVKNVKRRKLESPLPIHHDCDENSHISLLETNLAKQKILEELKSAYLNLQQLGIHLSKTTIKITTINTSTDFNKHESQSASSSSSSDSDLEDEDGFLESLLLSSSNNCSQDKDNKNSIATKQINNYTIHRTSDQQILYDIFSIIRSCTRVFLYTASDKTDNNSNHNDGLPFVPPNMIPCTRFPEHPSCKAFHILSHAFQTIHMYCIDNDENPSDQYHKNSENDSNNIYWNSLFHDNIRPDINDNMPNNDNGDNHEKIKEEEWLLLEQIRIGMFRRKSLVSSIISSLHGEIVFGWSKMDRSSLIPSCTHMNLPTNNHNDKDNMALQTGELTRLLSFITTNTVGSNKKKPHLKLIHLAERLFHIQLIIHFYIQYQQDYAKATSLILDYILHSMMPMSRNLNDQYLDGTVNNNIDNGKDHDSINGATSLTQPAVTTIQHYEYQLPVLSICILEALFQLPPTASPHPSNCNNDIDHSNHDNNNKTVNDDYHHTSWFSSHVLKHEYKIFPEKESHRINHHENGMESLKSIISWIIVDTFQWYKDRLIIPNDKKENEKQKSPNARIQDLCIVELRSFERMIKCNPWIVPNSSFTTKDSDHHLCNNNYNNINCESDRRLNKGIHPTSSVDCYSSKITSIKTIMSLSTLQTQPQSLSNDSSDCKYENKNNKSQLQNKNSSMAVLFGLLLLGDLDFVQTTYQKIISISMNSNKNYCNDVIVACFKAYTMIVSHHWNIYCSRSLKDVELPSKILFDKHGFLSTAMDQLFLQFSKELESDFQKQSNHCDGSDTCTVTGNCVGTFLRCCIITADGYYAGRWMKQLMAINDKYPKTHLVSKCSIMELSHYPIVRVINLKRRYDRWYNFIYQARNQQLLVLKAVISEKTLVFQNKLDNGDRDFFFEGDYAFDGQEWEEGYLDDNRKKIISKYVSTKWCPSDLAAFDRNAPNGNKVVKSSESERACALSHVSSWVGVQQTLSNAISSMKDMKRLGSLDTSLCINPYLMFEVSGFARGKALLEENENMPPTPVCIILEDDAHLVDRFTDKLTSLLDELPRDFHFCSIGYGRPKSAPLIKYSSELAVPTFLWYLTGYILSLEGANYLLSSQNLPVKGPVDSWIGLQMLNKNWDNIYGQRFGVGTTKTHKLISAAAVAVNDNRKNNKDNINVLPKPPSKKEMAKFLKFRAFAALTPLCSQKIGWATATNNKNNSRSISTSEDRAKWRDRDTDIAFTGHGHS